MILLTITVIFSILLLTVEIPVFLRMRDSTDLQIAVLAGMMLAACIVVMYYWR